MATDRVLRTCENGMFWCAFVLLAFVVVYFLGDKVADLVLWWAGVR